MKNLELFQGHHSLRPFNRRIHQVCPPLPVPLLLQAKLSGSGSRLIKSVPSSSSAPGTVPTLRCCFRKKNLQSGCVSPATANSGTPPDPGHTQTPASSPPPSQTSPAPHPPHPLPTTPPSTPSGKSTANTPAQTAPNSPSPPTPEPSPANYCSSPSPFSIFP